ncbi:uncharacterized protein CIMG_09897 [Coccidioides immitis RS]|uniref:Thioesterase domain-containing protein n=4 Tax=Coccidioides immitis TaxID=5501 RepID=J3K0D4_COCIM|nr:uncharacterized protein CIMG_09897 [Coccidioides immitis RS]KMP09255.1 hypothetical protein CIRG_09425 [Coccidioides immitis RMSCC 2394]KMU81890.1 hypothetical protein CISG_09358 [Coccidioides immitis RMSCC 3703]KMU91872.1 hypothetical protein CIHG_09723 [Coccidioides immitis H538.4]TPX20137.1 hypothetical protein DIZ76_016025 [Coccidioides immitis]EAS27292.3 hypothetical protein CIMG_09897 [Coccidioides immitis RS]
MMDDSLFLVQSAPDGFESATPLVLIHDGGGTTVSYFYLESLDRTVYAIQNPRFYSGEPWEGGLPEMGRIYASLIRSVLPSGPIILGGWSLGGMISLEVASILARTSDIQVLGIVMIDSINPLNAAIQSANVAPHQVEYDEHTRPETRELVSNCMKMAVAMSSDWIPPVWKGCGDQDLIGRRKAMEATLSSRMPAQYGNSCSVTEMDVPWRDILPTVPPTVLLRCNEYVPISSPEGCNAVSRVDVCREMPRLGWEEYGYDMISTVMDIPGHHFNIFAKDHLDEVSSQVKLACRLIERAGL